MATMLRKQLDFARFKMYGVDGDEARTQQAEVRQPLQRTHTVFLETLLDLCDGLVHVHVHRQIEFTGKCCDLAQALVADGVGRMRGETKTQQRFIAQFIAQRQPLAQVILGRLNTRL